MSTVAAQQFPVGGTRSPINATGPKPLSDSLTLIRRQLKHQLRYPSLTLIVVLMPVIFLLLFVFVLGGTLGAGLGGTRAQYLDFVTPGIMITAMAGTAQGTAISVAMDMTQGIVARFRTMAIPRAAVLTGHVVSAVLQTLLAVLVIIAVALAIGFRPSAGPLQWLAALGLLTLIATALTWFTVAIGMTTRTVEAASNLPMPLLLLPFFGSGFVPTESMPTVLRWFAEYQPFTPFIDTLRGLMLGTPIGNSALISVIWCLVISAGGYLWARSRYARGPARRP